MEVQEEVSSYPLISDKSRNPISKRAGMLPRIVM